jgi:hypothetical protein
MSQRSSASAISGGSERKRAGSDQGGRIGDTRTSLGEVTAVYTLFPRVVNSPVLVGVSDRLSALTFRPTAVVAGPPLAPAGPTMRVPVLSPVAPVAQ